MTAQRWSDHAVIRDRFVLDGQAFARWCAAEFGIRDRDSAMQRITGIDPLAERVVIDGLDYQIPDVCYQKLEVTSEPAN
jgi:hypothetical protein